MTPAAIIEEIKRLTPAQQVEIIQFAVMLAREHPLTANELTALAHRMVESEDPAEVERLRTAIVRGFHDSSQTA